MYYSLIIILIYIILLILCYFNLLKNKKKSYLVFFYFSFIGSLTILIIASKGIYLYGISEMIMDVFKKLNIK